MEGTLYDQIYQHLLNEIQTGKFKKNDRVPSETELAAKFQVSRITSKKALETLAQAGAIVRIRGKGSFVSETFSSTMEEHATKNAEEEKGQIGIIFSDFSDCFGMTILQTVEKRLSELGYQMILKLTHNSQEAEEQAIRSLLNSGVQGLLINPVNGEHYNEELLKLVYRKFPLVLMDKHLKGIPACAVYTNHKEASQKLTGYLLQQGYQHIAFISTPEEHTSSIEERIHGFTSAFLLHGKAIHADAIFTQIPINASQWLENESILRDFICKHAHIHAFVACEYPIALFLSHVINKYQDSIDHKPRIVCFDSPHALYESIRYSHIHQNETLIAEKSVEYVLAQMQGVTVPLQTIVDYSFIE